MAVLAQHIARGTHMVNASARRVTQDMGSDARSAPTAKCGFQGTASPHAELIRLLASQACANASRTMGSMRESATSAQLSTLCTMAIALPVPWALSCAKASVSVKMGMS